MMTINGKVFKDNIQGNSIIIKNGKVIVDGKEVLEENAPNISIEITGDVGSLRVDAANMIKVDGTVKGDLNTMSGDVRVQGDVEGSIKTASGDVYCGHVTGSVNTMSGDIDADEIHGNVKTVSGDIYK